MKRELADLMAIARGNEKPVAIPASEVVKLQSALTRVDKLLGKNKTCCDFCDFKIDWSINKLDK